MFCEAGRVTLCDPLFGSFKVARVSMELLARRLPRYGTFWCIAG